MQLRHPRSLRMSREGVRRPSRRRSQLGGLLLLLLLALAPVAWAQAPARLVVDLDATPLAVSSEPRELTLCGASGTVFFSADHPDWGRELWKSDGTVAGTVLVRDFAPGMADGDPALLVCAGSTLYFLADAGGPGRRLWTSDGTEAGTVELSDAVASNIVPYGDTVFFVANDGVHGSELWKSDGTPAGTTLVVDLAPGAASSSPSRFEMIGSELFFVGNDGIHGFELMKSDGTAGGTTLVHDIVAGPGSPTLKLETAAAGALYFFAVDGGSSGVRLWRSDGTAAGTFEAGLPETAPFDPVHLTVVGSRVFFNGVRNATGRELWVSDGTPAGTSLVADIRPGGFHANPDHLAAVEDSLYFSAEDGVHGRELWKTDGTAAGTALVVDLTPGGSSSHTHFTCQEAVGSKLRFVSTGGYWITDGTAAGTTLVFDPAHEPTDLANDADQCGIDVGDAFWLIGQVSDSAPSSALGFELWISAGTPAVSSVINIAPDDGTVGSGPGMLAEAEGRLFFVANHLGAGWEVSLYDPSTGEVELVKDVDPTEGSSENDGNYFRKGSTSYTSSQETFYRVGDALLFRGRDNGLSDWELWRTDGTEAGTTRVDDILVGPSGALTPSDARFPKLPAAVVAGKLLFEARTIETGYELWKSDGSTAGTELVADIRPGTSSSSIEHLVAVDDLAFFSAYEPVYGWQLWVSDGTASGTERITEISRGSGASIIDKLTAMDGQLYFVADSAAEGAELWTSNGTPVGTGLVLDILPGSGSSAPSTPVAWNGALYFAADDGVHGRELWRSAGTAASTALFFESVEGAIGGNPVQIVAGDDRLFFVTSKLGSNDTLWSTEGTPHTTRELITLGDTASPSPIGSPISCLQPIDELALFGGVVPDTGREVWVSDGTPANTRMLADIQPGEGSSSPCLFTRVGDVVVFSAGPRSTGTELWEIPLSDLVELRQDSDGDGVWDVSEIDRGLDSEVADSDDDGLSDGAELNVHATDPLVPDSDGDGFTDGEEVAAGSDPNDGASFPSSVPGAPAVGVAIVLGWLGFRAARRVARDH